MVHAPADAHSVYEILEALVSFPTVSSESNLPLIDWVEEWLSLRGITGTRVYDESGQKAAFYAHTGPMEAGAVVLSGHTDVVPVEGQEWTSDPYVLTRRGSRIYGRGACDMKGFDALALWAMGQAAERGVARPLQIALSYDEEVGCVGAPPMIDHMIASGLPKGDVVFVGEPSNMGVVTGHKGGYGWTVHVKGFEVHSSLMHTGVSAILEGSRLLMWINEMNDENRAKEPKGSDAMFEPPWTTVHCGKAWGGTAHNITAADFHMGVDFRLVPGDDIKVWEERLMTKVAELEAPMKAIHPDAGFIMTPRFHVPALRPEADGPAERLARQMTGDNGSHVVSYGTEAGQFQERGYSAVVCGPGDIAQAHQPDEFIEASELEKGQAFMERLLDHLATPV
ncbi:acetylornithine deacetylase [Alphaproteobacteria bacterium KMM 3653]|uniref:Acetylornithine deacetylase n=1 Tax=Harenicola maris TaxID=2841044 RepID=A0AAP2CMH3_9RHOB|nr:acetylornithine deacetylase [Harenicola maris]